ncbi:eyes shut isoform X2 [Leptinotarsa decemlineata]|uniref:eyes shut isoform X2 n=1 Tax=Leptinotarsa decemlineata TaxID=7539 RepID=UPI003D30A1EA
MYKIGGQRCLLLCAITLLLQLPSVRNGFACLSNPCVHGVCLDDLNSTYFCYCIDGYTGIQCQTNWNECWSSPCQNGGICIDGIAMFDCSCPAGYAGTLCEEDINECESNPCQNNGTCLDAQNGYTCNCLPGYSGMYCDIDIAVCNATNETRCSNGGICEEGPGETFTCRCQPGWGGLLCDVEIDECASAPCQNGAACIDLHAKYSCACLFGFTGQNCEEVMQICDDNPCNNGALCLLEENRAECYCVPDFHGDFCQYQYDECQLGPRCMNGGTCIDGIDNSTCSCPPYLTGVLCECLILPNNTLDCTYVRPKPTDIPTATSSYDNMTINSVTFTTILTSISTIQVPTTEISTQMTISTNNAIPITSTYAIEESSTTEISKQTFMTTLSPTDYTPFGNDLSSSSSSTMFTTDTTTVSTELQSLSTEVTFQTTEQSVSSNLNSEFPTYSTSVYFETSPVSYFDNFTSAAPEQFTSTVVFESSSTISATSFLTDITTHIEDTTVFNTSLIDVEMNRTFPEYSSTYISNFFTTEPTKKIEASTFTSTIPTTFETTTYSSTEESSTVGRIDCTRYETRCQNGGTCVFIESNNKCVCPFDYEGMYCEVKLGIKKAAFNGHSYLSHRLLSDSYRISLEFEAMTMANDGLLFFCNIDLPHMALYMENGYLKFRFSCGYQTMLLSELKVPVNEGYTMNIKAGLDFSRNFQHCNASIRVNNSLSMTGDQTARINRFSHPSAWLHLGGLPADSITGASLPVGGFVGCMSNLKIANQKVNIYENAEDGQEVTECSSLACLSNPCRNGASCTSSGNRWHCHCRNGYLGIHCEISVCDDNPCLFGGTCIPFTNSGYICLCPYGKHGHFCESDLKVREPYFSSTVQGLSSFVAYPFPDGISKNMELKFRIRPTTMEQISLLLFIGQAGHHDFYSDHIAVSFVKGYIMLTWNLGSGPRRIFTSQPIKKGAKDYLIRLGHSGRRAWLYVENLGNTTGRSPGTLVQLDVSPLLYIGGHDSKNFSNLPHDLPLHTGFSGCIYGLEMKSGSVVIPFQGNFKTFGRAVGQCGTSECYDRSCQNGGACLHHGSTFMCLCQDDWFGPLCSSRNNLCHSGYTKCSRESRCVPQLSNYECDCPLGKTGKYCEKDEIVTDVSFTGKRSFIALKPVELEEYKFHFEFEIRLLKDQGIILFMGRRESTFICLSLLNGLIELKIKSGASKIPSSSITSVRSSKLLVRAVWYTVKFGMFGRKIYLSVNNLINTGILDDGHFLGISRGTIFLGGLPDMSEIPICVASSFPDHFQGCIRNLFVNDISLPLTNLTIKESRNVEDCDGTPCGEEICQNGGTCWLDSFMQPHCSCIPPYFGNECKNVSVCDEKSCRNEGKCLNNKCTCVVGYSGALCENKIAVATPKFNGQSYMFVKRVGDRKRDLKTGNVESITLNFTTVKRNGLLLWTEEKEKYLGIGLEKGFIKIAISSTEFRKSLFEVPMYTRVSDGLWHAINISLNPLKLTVDGVDVVIHRKLEKGEKLSGDFLIGGVPENESVVVKTKGFFSHPFEGCISSFGTNSFSITDFSIQDGSNIGSCEYIQN